MNRRNFLGVLAAIPGFSWLKPKKREWLTVTVRHGHIVYSGSDAELVARLNKSTGG